MKKILILSILIFIGLVAPAQNWETEHARNLIKEGNYVEAAQMLRPLAEGGDAEAQYLAASLFFEGKGVMKSEEQGMKYLSLSARQYHIGATVVLALKMIKTHQPERVTAMLEDCMKNNADAAKSKVAYVLSLLTPDREKAWQLVANCASTKDGEYYLNKEEVKSVLSMEHEAFYEYLIDTYINEPAELRQKLLSEYFRSVSSDEGYKWAHESMGYLMDKIRELPFEKQDEHYSVWFSASNMYRLFRTICACMSFEGLGVKRNLAYARELADDIKRTGSIEYSWVDEQLDLILNTYESGLKLASGRVVTGVDGNMVSVLENDKERVFSTGELTQLELAAAQAKADREQRKHNIKAYSTAQRIKVNASPRVEYKYGDLELTFTVRAECVNNVNFVIGSAGCTTETDFDSVDCSVTGLERLSSLNVIRPGNRIYVKVKIKGVPRTGEFRQVAVSFSSDIGSGHILANNVVW